MLASLGRQGKVYRRDMLACGPVPVLLDCLEVDHFACQQAALDLLAFSQFSYQADQENLGGHAACKYVAILESSHEGVRTWTAHMLGGGRICVAVRVRPLDLTRDESVLLDSHPVLQLLDADGSGGPGLKVRTTDAAAPAFHFDRPPQDDTPQADVFAYATYALDLVEGALGGGNALLLSYGGAGSGKSQTLVGMPEISVTR